MKGELFNEYAEIKRPVIVVEAAMMLDGGWDDMMDAVWIVTVPREVALQRLMESRGMTENDAELRLDAQISRRGIGNLEEEVRNGIVTAVIENGGNEESLKARLAEALDDQSCWKQT